MCARSAGTWATDEDVDPGKSGLVTQIGMGGPGFEILDRPLLSRSPRC